MFRRNSIAFTESDLQLENTERQKRNSIVNFLSQDQLLYKINATRIIPKDHHEVGIEGDTIPLDTRFDNQSTLGKFIYDELDDIYKNDGVYEELQQTQQYSNELSNFCEHLMECMRLRDKYIGISNQRNIDNPINDRYNWETYSKPPAKGWHYSDDYGKSDYYFDMNDNPKYSGEKFDINDYIKTVLKSKIGDQSNLPTLKREKHGNYYFHGFNHSKKPTFDEYFKDLSHIIDSSVSKIGSLLCSRRNDFLKAKYESYSLLNESREIYLTKLNPHRDFYNARKIDNNIGVSMSMSKNSLLYIINDKLKTEPKRVVYEENGVSMTLEELFEPYFANDSKKRFNIDDLFEFGLIDKNDPFNLTVDSDASYEHIIKNEYLLRIDKTFLRIDNKIKGEYLSSMMKYVMSDYEKSKYQYGEMGLSFNLMSDYERFGYKSKWESISSWIIDNRLVSHNVKWNIIIPRNFSSLKESNKVLNFQEYLDLIFKELFEISINPLKNPKLHFFLTKVSTINVLSSANHNDESLFDFKKLQAPRNWNNSTNPPYCYYLYYIYLNISNLNEYRKSRGFNTFSLRPHAASISSKSGHGIITESLSASFLLAKGIINGEKLENYPVLQYLYYLKQIGITMSPLTWNKRVQFLNDDDRNTEPTYTTHPIIDFFHKGLKVSLSTNKPLFSSLTRDPLIEEYSLAASINKLGSVDLCELARNSVLNSEFNGSLKAHWIGIKYRESYIDHEDIDEYSIQRSNVPPMRLDYRSDTLRLEFEFLKDMERNNKRI